MKDVTILHNVILALDPEFSRLFAGVFRTKPDEVFMAHNLCPYKTPFQV